MKKMKRLVFTIILLPIFYIIGVMLLAYFTDYQPPVYQLLPIEGKGVGEVDKMEFTLMTWNLGYGGNGKEMDFFYDGGTKMRNEQAIVEKNVNYILNTLSDSFDFMLFQEIDIKARRSYQINEVQKVADKFPNYAYIFGKNYDVKFVPKPYTDPMGNVLGGIATFGKYRPEVADFHAYKNSYKFPDYLFYLDRCFTTCFYPLPNGKKLVLINAHNSAYDPGGKMKVAELALLKEISMTEYKKGNYVIIGADWNQYPPHFKGVNGFGLKDTTEGGTMKENFPDEGWHCEWDSTTATCRSMLKGYDPKTTYRVIIDYFLVSPNVEKLYVKTLDLNFECSDHQPVVMKVKLK